jgi:hypothetical protein
MRKEGAIQSAEEARILKELSVIEHAKKENEFVAELREMVERKAQGKQQPPGKRQKTDSGTPSGSGT